MISVRAHATVWTESKGEMDKIALYVMLIIIMNNETWFSRTEEEESYRTSRCASWRRFLKGQRADQMICRSLREAQVCKTGCGVSLDQSLVSKWTFLDSLSMLMSHQNVWKLNWKCIKADQKFSFVQKSFVLVPNEGECLKATQKEKDNA